MEGVRESEGLGRRGERQEGEKKGEKIIGRELGR